MKSRDYGFSRKYAWISVELLILVVCCWHLGRALVLLCTNAYFYLHGLVLNQFRSSKNFLYIFHKQLCDNGLSFVY